MEDIASRKVPPSAGWTSYNNWDYDGMKSRLEGFVSTVNKSALTEHAQAIPGQPVSISEAFSAGQHWCCFELMPADGCLIIARVRLPKHLDGADGIDEDSETYLMQCEVETMKFLLENVTYVQSSEQISTQEHIITQWTSIQAELASFTFPWIGSIAYFSKDMGAMIGKLSTAVADGRSTSGPFKETWDYFVSIAEARFLQARKIDTPNNSSNHFARLGFFVFKDIVYNTALFKTGSGPFHFNHMDMEPQNIIVDQDFNFIAIIDWEFAQTAPWEVNHYPMPFPLISSEAETDSILRNPEHIAHNNVLRHVAAQNIYHQKFLEAEQTLKNRGRPLQKSIADILDSPAARIYAAFEKLDVFIGMDEELIYEMVRLAYRFDGKETKRYLSQMENQMKDGDPLGKE